MFNDKQSYVQNSYFSEGKYITRVTYSINISKSEINKLNFTWKCTKFITYFHEIDS